MKKLSSPLLLVMVCAALLAQQTKPAQQVASCGRGENKSHPCKCMQHWSDVQNAYVAACQGKNMSVERLVACIRDEPENVRDHCAAVESYGNWHMNDKGEHDTPMPNQCSSACMRRDCRCADGAQHPGPDSKTVCHFGRSYEEDLP
jgi:hypothetical protein